MAATTIHALFDLDRELQSKLNLAKLDDPKVAFLLQLEVLMLDEVRGDFSKAVLDEGDGETFFPKPFHVARAVPHPAGVHD